MSGVYIKGLKMPTDFSGTRLIIYPNGQVLFPHRTYFDELHGVEAIPVPDHGRLIDADAMLDVWDDNHTIPSAAAKVVEKTIIPADKEEDT